MYDAAIVIDRAPAYAAAGGRAAPPASLVVHAGPASLRVWWQRSVGAPLEGPLEGESRPLAPGAVVTVQAGAAEGGGGAPVAYQLQAA